MDKIPEKDWKKLRAIEEDLLDKAVSIILSRIRSLIDERRGGNQKTYHSLWDLMREEDKKIGYMFDDMKRSSAENNHKK